MRHETRGLLMRSALLSVLILAAFIVAGRWSIGSSIYHWFLFSASSLALSAVVLVWWPVLQSLHPLLRGMFTLLGVTGVSLLLMWLTQGWPEVRIHEGNGGWDGISVPFLLLPTGLCAAVLLVPLSLLMSRTHTKKLVP